jgi:hypothetical protein
MLHLLFPIAVVCVVLWFLGFWPFDRSYSFIPKYSEWRRKKVDTVPPGNQQGLP